MAGSFSSVQAFVSFYGELINKCTFLTFTLFHSFTVTISTHTHTYIHPHAHTHSAYVQINTKLETCQHECLLFFFCNKCIQYAFLEKCFAVHVYANFNATHKLVTNTNMHIFSIQTFSFFFFLSFFPSVFRFTQYMCPMLR